MTEDMNTLLTLALMGGFLGLLSFIAFAVWVSFQVRSARREAEKIRIENEAARPVLMGIAKEFRTDSGTSFRDSFNRFEVAGDLAQQSIDLLQRTVEELRNRQIAQAAINDQTEDLIGGILVKLNGVMETVAQRGEVRAALALEKLISDLKSEQLTRREHNGIALNVNLAGAGASVGASAAGTAIDQAQAGVNQAQAGVNKAQTGVDKTQAAIDTAKKELEK